MVVKAEVPHAEPEDERRFRVGELQPIDPTNRQQLAAALQLMRYQRVREHLYGVPKNEDELARYYSDEVYGFLGINEMGEVVSTGALRPPGNPLRVTRTYDPNLERLCVRPDMERRGIGRQTTFLLLEKGFTPTEQGGFGYSTIGLGVVAGPRGWEDVQNFFLGMGFSITGYHPHGITLSQGENKPPIVHPVITMYMHRKRFEDDIQPRFRPMPPVTGLL